MAAVRAVYLDGTLRLLDPVDLKAGQIVTLRIETAEQGDLDDPSIEWNSLTTSEQDALLRAEFGASVRWADPNYDDGNAWVEEEAEELARALTTDKPIADEVFEDREEPF